MKSSSGSGWLTSPAAPRRSSARGRTSCAPPSLRFCEIRAYRSREARPASGAYRRRIEDDLPTLDRLGLLVRPDPARHSHSPRRFTPQDAGGPAADRAAPGMRQRLLHVRHRRAAPDRPAPRRTPANQRGNTPCRETPPVFAGKDPGVGSAQPGDRLVVTPPKRRLRPSHRMSEPALRRSRQASVYYERPTTACTHDAYCLCPELQYVACP